MRGCPNALGDGKLMRSRMRKFIYSIVAVALLAFSMTLSCSGENTRYFISSSDTQTSREQALVSVLMDELAKRGIDDKAAMSCPPTGDCNKAADVEAIPDGVGGWLLRWEYVNHGDYNHDGVVGVADVTPLAAHYGELDSIIGGDGTQSINVSHVTPIAQHFATEIAGFKVEAGASTIGPWVELGRVLFTELTLNGGWLQGHISLPAIDNRYYTVTPYDASEAMGICSDPYTPSLSAPVITAVRPSFCCNGVASVFQADVTGEGLRTYAWDFGPSGSPLTSDAESPSIIFLQAGEMQCSLTVSTVFGSDQFNFTVEVVEYGDAPYITNVQPQSAITGVPVLFGAIVGGAEPLNYSWSFQDGEPATSTDINPVATFADPGSHQVTLTVTNSIDFAEYSFILTAVEGLDIELVSMRVRIEDTINTLVGSIYLDKDLYAMPLSGNAQGEGDIGCAIHGYLESISYTYVPDDQIFGFDDAPPEGKLDGYNATLEYLRTQIDWSLALGGYTEDELITHDPGELPGELLGEISMIIGEYEVKAELPVGVLGLTQPLQLIIDMNFVESGG